MTLLAVLLFPAPRKHVGQSYVLLRVLRVGDNLP
jgi:hypothetical protein